MGKPKASSIDVPDPIEIINAEKMANRTNTITPFGQSVWEGDSQVTTFGPQMQAASDRMFGLLEQGQQRIEPPPFMNDLLGAVAGRVGERYGLSGMDASKPQASMQPPQMSLPPGAGVDSPAPMPVQPAPAPGAPPPGFGGLDPNQQNQQVMDYLNRYSAMSKQNPFTGR